MSKLNESFKSKEVAEKVQNLIDDFLKIREKERIEELENQKIIEALILQKQKDEAEEQKKKQEKENILAQENKENESQKPQVVVESKFKLPENIFFYILHNFLSCQHRLFFECIFGVSACNIIL